MDALGGLMCVFMGLVFTVIPVGFVLLIVFLIVRANRIAKEQTQARRILAQRFGLDFDARHDARLMGTMADFRLFNLGHSRNSGNVAWGRTQGVEITIFDYRYTTGFGRHRHLHPFTVVAILDVGADLPRYRVWPRSSLDWLRLWADADEFRLGDGPFDERFCLAGPEQRWIGDVLNEAVVRFHLDNPDLQVEADRERLLVYRYTTTGVAAEDLIDRALDLAELLRRSARAEERR